MRWIMGRMPWNICYMDVAFQGGKIGVHPNDNTATIWMRTDDLLHLIRENGNEADVVAF